MQTYRANVTLKSFIFFVAESMVVAVCVCAFLFICRKRCQCICVIFTHFAYHSECVQLMKWWIIGGRMKSTACAFRKEIRFTTLRTNLCHQSPPFIWIDLCWFIAFIGINTVFTCQIVIKPCSFLRALSIKVRFEQFFVHFSILQ